MKHLRCSCNTSQSAGKAANQTSNKKPPDFGGFLLFKESEFTRLSNIFYRLVFLILSWICLYLS
ncbi:hypothetical protein MWH01_41050, partial [Escherichia coli]|nr:hypothetical protein [Escherichia coli]